MSYHTLPSRRSSTAKRSSPAWCAMLRVSTQSRSAAGRGCECCRGDAPASGRTACRVRTRSACCSRRAASCPCIPPAAGCATREAACARSRTLRAAASGAATRPAQPATRAVRAWLQRSGRVYGRPAQLEVAAAAGASGVNEDSDVGAWHAPPLLKHALRVCKVCCPGAHAHAVVVHNVARAARCGARGRKARGPDVFSGVVEATPAGRRVRVSSWRRRRRRKQRTARFRPTPAARSAASVVQATGRPSQPRPQHACKHTESAGARGRVRNAADGSRVNRDAQRFGRGAPGVIALSVSLSLGRSLLHSLLRSTSVMLAAKHCARDGAQTRASMCGMQQEVRAACRARPSKQSVVRRRGCARSRHDGIASSPSSRLEGGLRLPLAAPWRPAQPASRRLLLARGVQASGARAPATRNTSAKTKQAQGAAKSNLKGCSVCVGRWGRQVEFRLKRAGVARGMLARAEHVMRRIGRQLCAPSRACGPSSSEGGTVKRASSWRQNRGIHGM
jgi:hypothetical protein